MELLSAGEQALQVIGKLRELEATRLDAEIEAVANGEEPDPELVGTLDAARDRLLERYGDLLSKAGYGSV